MRHIYFALTIFVAPVTTIDDGQNSQSGGRFISRTPIGYAARELLLSALVFLAFAPTLSLAQSPHSLAAIRYARGHLIAFSKSAILAAKKAYALSGNGTQNKEFGFALMMSDDGSFWTTDVNGFEAGVVKISAPPGTIAVFHTHRNNVNPRPSSRDIQEADDKQLIFGVISHDGLWVYEPDPAKKGKGVTYKVRSWFDRKEDD